LAIVAGAGATLFVAIIGPEFADAGRDSGRLVVAGSFSIASLFSTDVEDALESRRFSDRAEIQNKTW